MKLKIIVLFVALVFVGPVAYAKGQFLCANDVTNELVQVNPSSEGDTCVQDLVWGGINVCFIGDAQDLVTQINSDKFKWLSEGYSILDGSYNSAKDIIVFTGVDARSFYTNSGSDVHRCREELLELYN